MHIKIELGAAHIKPLDYLKLFSLIIILNILMKPHVIDSSKTLYFPKSPKTPPSYTT